MSRKKAQKAHKEFKAEMLSFLIVCLMCLFVAKEFFL